MPPETAPANVPACHGSAAPVGAVCLSVEARAQLRRRFGLTEAALDAAIARCFAGEVRVLPDDTVLRDAQELVARMREGRSGWFMHACPVWRREALRWYPELASAFTQQHETQTRGAEAAMQRHDTEAVRVTSCALRSEQARSLTARRLMRMLLHSGLPLKSCEDELPTRMDSVLTAARALTMESTAAPPLRYTPVDGMRGTEAAQTRLAGRELRLARVCGTAAALALAQRMTLGEQPFDVIEVYSCAGGC